MFASVVKFVLIKNMLNAAAVKSTVKSTTTLHFQQTDIGIT